jgi:hypothetical protein
VADVPRVPRGKDFAYIRHLDTTMPEFYELTTDESQLSSRPSMVTQNVRSKLSRLTTLKAGRLRAVEDEA